ncbi:MAG: F-type H+-transporting ATPase subunit b [Pseudonocardiales bacterium]|jgi:F-type H+-transporting ATPase subunit b|nr:F-type H+-transporting ATPase subunit b [Pseudonocardiales bacterium]
MAKHVMAEGNFLLPNWTFVAELVAFVLILWILGHYVYPFISKAMTERQEMIKKQVEDAEEAKTKLAEAEKAYQNALNEARTEAAQIRENARAEAQRTVEELRAQATEEQQRIVQRGEDQLAMQRASIVRELRGEIGTLAVELAGKIVDQRLADEANVSSTVDAFLAGLESQDKAVDRSGSA